MPAPMPGLPLNPRRPRLVAPFGLILPVFVILVPAAAALVAISLRLPRL